jgi:hypothetical protein
MHERCPRLGRAPGRMPRLRQRVVRSLVAATCRAARVERVGWPEFRAWAIAGVAATEAGLAVRQARRQAGARRPSPRRTIRLRPASGPHARTIDTLRTLGFGHASARVRTTGGEGPAGLVFGGSPSEPDAIARANRDRLAESRPGVSTVTQ